MVYGSMPRRRLRSLSAMRAVGRPLRSGFRRRFGVGYRMRRSSFRRSYLRRLAQSSTSRGTRGVVAARPDIPLYAPSFATKPEMKFKDTPSIADFTFGVGPAAATAVLLNGIPLGTSVSERIAQRVQGLCLHFRMLYRGQAANANSIVSAALIYDRSTNGVMPPGNVPFVAAFPWFQEFAQRARFRVLARWMRSVVGPNTGNTSQSFGTIDEKIAFNLPVQYSTDGAAPADIVSGGLYLYIWALNGVIEGNYGVRFLYADA